MVFRACESCRHLAAAHIVFTDIEDRLRHVYIIIARMRKLAQWDCTIAFS
jgi:hypothetical protein